MDASGTKATERANIYTCLVYMSDSVSLTTHEKEDDRNLAQLAYVSIRQHT